VEERKAMMKAPLSPWWGEYIYGTPAGPRHVRLIGYTPLRYYYKLLVASGDPERPHPIKKIVELSLNRLYFC
jgi:hypothetical protein